MKTNIAKLRNIKKVSNMQDLNKVKKLCKKMTIRECGSREWARVVDLILSYTEIRAKGEETPTDSLIRILDKEKKKI